MNVAKNLTTERGTGKRRSTSHPAIPTIRGRINLMKLLLRIAVLVAATGAVAAPARGQRVADPLDRPAVPSRSPERAVLLDITQAGNRLVAVGERGIVVISDNAGKSWRQAKVPTSVSLTAVAFHGPKFGWAVGHGGIILHSEDGGESWTRQLDGAAAAKLALDAAQAKASAAPKDAAAQRLLADAERLVSDGPDKPFLDLEFESDTAGFVVGAYGLMFRTEDGGKSWMPWMDRLDNPKGLHINCIRAAGSNVYLAGEQGLFLRSSDGGKSFTRIETPYNGTYFTVAVANSGDIVLAGLRGNAYWSATAGKVLTKSDVPVPISFSASLTEADGTLLFANQAGNLLESHDSGRTMQPLHTVAVPPISAFTQLPDGSLLTVGFAGVFPVSLSGHSPAAAAGGKR